MVLPMSFEAQSPYGISSSDLSELDVGGVATFFPLVGLETLEVLPLATFFTTLVIGLMVFVFGAAIFGEGGVGSWTWEPKGVETS